MTAGDPSDLDGAPLTPTQAAALWILRRTDADNPLDLAALEAWLAEDDANRKAWASATRGWDAFEPAEDVELLLGLRRQALRVRPAASATPWRWAAAAAVFVMAATLGIVGLRHSAPHADPKLEEAASTDYASGVGQRREVALSDGSHMTLDTDTRVAVSFAHGRRDLRLAKGRAFFQVAHDQAHPFTVEAGGQIVTAVGTSFDVRVDADRVKVVLVDGRVSIGAVGSPPTTFLEAGQQWSLTANGHAQVTAADVQSVSDWRAGQVQFTDEPLSSVVVELNRYSGAVQLVVRDPKVGALRVTGTFRTGDLPRFARTLSEVYPVRVIQPGPGRLEIIWKK